MVISNLAITFRTAVFVLIAVLVVAGVISYRTLPREGSPDITIPFIFVTALYEGTAPEDMEKLVTIPLERQFNDVENIKTIRSTTAEGVTSIQIEFLSGQDIDVAQQKVKDKIDLAWPDLPQDLDQPIVQAFNFSTDFPIFIFALHGDRLDRLTTVAEDLQERIEVVNGVRQATLSGTREREVRVELDLPRLIAFDIPIELVMQRIAEENKTVSAGNLEVRGDRFQVRVPGEVKLATDLREIPLVFRDQRPVFLRDVAEVMDTYKDVTSISRLNGEPSVSIEVRKRNRENTVQLIREIKAEIEGFGLPPDLQITYVLDMSEYVDMMISELENNIFTGFLLVVSVLFLFMGFRNSLFVGMAIPMSMLIAFSLINLQGTTLNMIVLFSLVLALGMLVDNAIVIVENIYRLRTTGLSRIEAARRGAGDVAWPVITSTITTCLAFAPLLFWPDIMGQFMSFLPLTLILTLSASLFVAIVINPAVCSAFIARGKQREGLDELGIVDNGFTRGYERVLRAANHHRVAVLFMAFLFLFASVEFYIHFGKGVELFPEVDPRNASIQVKLPQGTSIERTDGVLQEIERLLPEYGEIKFFLATVGESGDMGMAGGGKATHMGQIFIEFVPYEERERSSMAVIEDIRTRLPRVPGAEITIDKQEEGPPTGAPVSVELSGEDFDTLAELAGRVIRAIETVPGLVDVQSDFEEALPELQFRVDRSRAAALGLDTRAIGNFLRAAVYGLEASKFRPDEDEFDITVRLPEHQRNTTDLLDRIFIPTPGGTSVPLTSLGEVVYEGGRGAITRKDRKRMITVTGSNQGRGVDQIIAEVIPLVEAVSLPRGYSVSFTGDTEEMQKSGAFLAKAFLIALGLIFVILVIQFNSVLLPMIIGFSVFLSMIGVMWGLLITGMRFGIIMTGVGVVSLAGIVVNNSIVLVDCILKRRAEGMSTEDAIVVAGKMRLRPVVLTAITTILGLIPMAVGYSLEIHEWPPRIIAGAETSEWWAPMAVAVIFGLAFSTVLTLVLVPVMFSLFDGMSSRLKAWAAVDGE
ncbi:MAG TPA: efflux RND transporter permease subunit [Kiritimatiellia bacterium]|nr:efflux RND transporter permease subunit [Kiritimatiellia bacterium]